jgi:tetratricopeptide (TPR) repeat protein
MSTRSAKSSLIAVFSALGVLLVAPGCDELQARRTIQKADRLYHESRFSKAVELYDEALALAPDLSIGHHNAALAYSRMFVPGSESPENLAVAEKAAHHFQVYLQSEPDDRKIIGLLTNLWLDSGQFEKALAYWEEELAKNPGNREVHSMLARINIAAGRHEKAIDWLYRRADLEAADEAKVQTYLDIANLQRSRLTKADLVDLERVAIADSGLAALARAEALAPDSHQVHSYSAVVYQLRSLSHGAAWAMSVDAVSQRYHELRRGELVAREAAKQPEEDKAPPAPAPPSSPDQP